MKEFIDSHCHVNSFDDNFEKYFEEVHGLDIFEYDRNFDLQKYLTISKKMKNFGLWIGAGVHPLSAEYSIENDTRDFLSSNIDNLDAIGETGIDLFKANNYEEQLYFLKLHCEFAKRFRKPVVVHCRGEVNIDEILQVLYGTCFVFHCFSYDLNTAMKVVKAGGYVSFSGIVTFKSAEELRIAVMHVPLHSILCETDSPYLAPVPKRGSQNIPKNVLLVYEKCAELKQMELNKFAYFVRNNFYNFINNKCVVI